MENFIFCAVLVSSFYYIAVKMSSYITVNLLRTNGFYVNIM